MITAKLAKTNANLESAIKQAADPRRRGQPSLTPGAPATIGDPTWEDAAELGNLVNRRDNVQGEKVLNHVDMSVATAITHYANVILDAVKQDPTLIDNGISQEEVDRIQELLPIVEKLDSEKGESRGLNDYLMEALRFGGVGDPTEYQVEGYGEDEDV